MSRTKKAAAPVDRKPSLSLTIYPWSWGSVITVDVGHHDSTGRHVSRIAYWHLELSRSELVGKSTNDVLRLLCERVLRRLESGPTDPADSVAVGPRHQAEGPGAPDGATGRAGIQGSLSGIQPTLDTGGGIAQGVYSQKRNPTVIGSASAASTILQ